MTLARPPERIDLEVVVVRRHRVEDAELIADAVAASLDSLRPWLPWASESAATAEFQRQRLREAVPNWDAGTEFSFVILDHSEEEVLGAVGLHRRIGPGALEIGYWLRPTETGRGLMSRIVRILVAAALDLPEIERVEIRCDESNIRSRAIPERLGFRLDRTVVAAVEAPAESGRNLIWVIEDPAHLT